MRLVDNRQQLTGQFQIDCHDRTSVLDPAAELISEKRTPAADAIASHQHDATPVAGMEISPDNPEIAAVLNQYVRDYENKWMDEPIPALGGWTPRAAVADPTRRDDVIRLIDSFPQDDQPGQMSGARLRELLGLP